MYSTIASEIRILDNKLENNKGAYFIYDNKENKKIFINQSAYQIIKFINEKKILKNKLKNNINNRFNSILFNIDDFLGNLEEENILIYRNKNYINKNILTSYKNYFSLQNISLEIIENCNLKCIHCYGNFGYKPNNFLSYNFIKDISKKLDILNTFKVALTGGKFFIHPEYEKIFNHFKKKGYKITVFTNGLLVKKIIDFVNKHKNIKFTLKVSLDGFKKTHNFIRKNNQSFDNAVKVLKHLKYAGNVTPVISVTIGKYNIKEMNKFIDFLNNEFGYTLNIDLVYPTSENESYSEFFYKENELDKIMKIFPRVLDYKLTDEKVNRKRFRCMGGINQAAISANKVFKICIAGNYKDFRFGIINNSDDLIKLWENPPEKIKNFRKEMFLDINKCDKCIYKNKCSITNCRVLAYAYTGSYKNPNPTICYSLFNRINS